MPWVYMLRCADDSIYVGSTFNLELRLSEHASGCTDDAYTRSRRPVELVFAQEYDRVDEARGIERRL